MMMHEKNLNLAGQGIELFGDIRQKLVFIGQGVNQDRVTQSLYDCLLNEEEVLRSKEYWVTMNAPFPTWEKNA
jgi:hypothetical protein